MKLEQYLEAVSDQIRCTKIRPSITEELRNHILDQADAYIECGAMEEEALERAVREMGDPVETGAALDRIHRPKMSWEIIGLIGFLSLLNIVALYLLNLSDYPWKPSWPSQMSAVFIGFAAMLLVCYIDYSFLGKHHREIAAAFLIFISVAFATRPISVNGGIRFIDLGFFTLSVSELLFLYVPLYGAVLYSYRGEGLSVLPKLLLWSLPPLFLLWNIPDLSSCCMLFACLFGMFAFAVAKDWYQLPRKQLLALITGTALLCPTLLISYTYYFGESYQRARIRELFYFGTARKDYMSQLGRQLLNSCSAFGQSSSALNLVSHGQVQEYHTNYILLAMSSVYGTIVVCCIVALLFWVIMKIFHISVRQRSQLGMITGVGCGLVFLVKTVLGVLNNLQLIPYTSIGIPFLSYGATGIIVSYILLGLVLSVYRYKDILPATGKCVHSAHF